MNKKILSVCLCVCPLFTVAQTEGDLESDLQARLSIGAEYNIAKRVQLSAEEQIRLNDNFGTFERFHTTVGLSWKFLPFIKAGISYSLINHYKTTASEWENRHRFSFDLTESFKYDYWTFSFKERLQFTHKSYDINTYQETQNPLAAKFRFMVKYTKNKQFKPYGFIETRIALNAPSCTATYNTTSETYTDYSFGGHNDIYLDRIRFGIGGSYSFSSHSSLSFYLLEDYCMDKDIDTNAEGTKLKSLVYAKALNSTIGVGYTYKF